MAVCRVFLGVQLGSAILYMSGCALPDALPEPERFESSAAVQVLGDWDDVESCVRVGASQSEIAIVRTRRVSETQYDFELVTITDEPARLTVSLDPARVGKGPAITLRAVVGRFGNKAWEERLIGRVGGRLGELYGVDIAPLEEP